MKLTILIILMCIVGCSSSYTGEICDKSLRESKSYSVEYFNKSGDCDKLFLETEWVRCYSLKENWSKNQCSLDSSISCSTKDWEKSLLAESSITQIDEKANLLEGTVKVDIFVFNNHVCTGEYFVSMKSG